MKNQMTMSDFLVYTGITLDKEIPEKRSHGDILTSFDGGEATIAEKSETNIMTIPEYQLYQDVSFFFYFLNAKTDNLLCFYRH